MQRLCQWMLSAFGWKISGKLPNIKHYVLIVAPHTSNWDLIIGLLAKCAVHTKIHFLVKKEVFVFPLNKILKPLGGIPIDRSRSTHRVDRISATFKERDAFILGIAPEGTRSPVKRWKFGFYYIAQKANVPIVMVGMDYQKKEVKIANPFNVSGKIADDYKIMLNFFKQIQGRYPKPFPDR